MHYFASQLLSSFRHIHTHTDRKSPRPPPVEPPDPDHLVEVCDHAVREADQPVLLEARIDPAPRLTARGQMIAGLEMLDETLVGTAIDELIAFHPRSHSASPPGRPEGGVTNCLAL